MKGVTMNSKDFLVVCEGYFPYGFGLSSIPAISIETETIEEAKKFVKENIKTTASIWDMRNEKYIDHGCSRLLRDELISLSRKQHIQEYGY
jgi:hypothetical protein